MEFLRADANGIVTLPNGAKVSAAVADARGYPVMGVTAQTSARAAAPNGSAAPTPEAVPSMSPQAAREAAYEAVLELPEAAGKFQAARHLAARGTDPDLAARLLTGAPLDPEPDAPTVAAPVPLTPQAARLAEIQALGAARRAGR